MPQQFQRFRMQIDLRRTHLPHPVLPGGYRWVPWRRLLMERHSQVTWRAFRNDMDGQVFPCLSQIEGCRRLMREIASQATFSANATWMLVYQPESGWPPEDCASIQGIARKGNIGAIQNVGVVPEHRGLGLGRAIVLQALQGFRFCGMYYGFLEVTAINKPAVQLYQSLGFEVTEVLYRDAGTGETMPQASITEKPDIVRPLPGQHSADSRLSDEFPDFVE